MASEDRDRYRYPDEGDRITLTFIGQREIPPEVWEEEESKVLEEIDTVLRTGPLLSLLDYGSGGGRLAVRYTTIFKSVTSFEPDLSRVQQQRDLVASIAETSRIRVLDNRGAITGQYDVVLCSHVIQHVPHAVVEDVLRDVTTFVAPGGFVVLTTTLSSRPTATYVLSFITNGGRVVEKEVSVEVFETTLRSGQVGVLPIHFFPFDGLVTDLDRLGMELVTAFGFHGSVGVVGPVTATSSPLLQCRDVAIVTRRR